MYNEQQMDANIYINKSQLKNRTLLAAKTIVGGKSTHIYNGYTL